MSDVIKEVFQKYKILNQKDIKSLTKPKLIGLGRKILREIDYLPELRAREIEAHPLVKAMIKIKNKAELEAIFKSKLFKAEVKQHCIQSFFDKRIPSVEEYVNYEIPLKTCEKILKKIAEHYKDFLFGIFIASFSEKGKLTFLNFDDTEDREYFTEVMIKVARKKRSGGSPTLSATLFKEGSLIFGTDRIAYRVIKGKNKKKRWVQHTDEEDSLIKAKPKQPQAPAKIFPENHICFGPDGAEYVAKKGRWKVL